MEDNYNIEQNINPDAIGEEIKTILKSEFLFMDLNKDEIELLSQKASYKKLTLGENVILKDELVKKFIYVYKGSLRKKAIFNGMLQTLGKFSEGEYFGELSFLKDYKCDYTISSSSPDTKLIIINTKDATLEKISEKLKSKIAYSQLFTKLRDLFSCSNIDNEWIRILTDNVLIQNYSQGEFIFNQGESNNSLYLILSGNVDLFRENLDTKAFIGVAGKDDFLGEYGILSGNKQGYDARVTSSTTLIEIQYEFGKQLLLKNSNLNTILADKIKQFETELSKFQGGLETDDEKKIYPEFEDTGNKKIKKFPWLHQHDESDCGAACLTMISKYYGLKLSMGQVRELANVNTEGATMGAVCRAAENLGYRARPFRLSYDGLKNINLPTIIHWQGYHWMVLFRIDSKFVWLADPALGIRKLTHEDFKKSWTRYTIDLEATEKLKELEPAKNPLMRFAKYLLPYKFYFIEIFIGSLILNMLGLASPLFIQNIIDNVIVYKDESLLNMMLLGMVMVTFFSTLTTSIQQLVMIHVTTRLDLKLLADFYKHVLSLPMKFFYSRKTGDIITRFGENSKVRAILSGSAITTVLNVIMVVIYVTMMFAYSTSLSWVVLAFLPAFIAMTYIFTPIIKRISNDIFTSNSDQSSIMIESIQGIETIKANSVEWNVRTKWEDSYVDNVNLSAKMQKTQMIAGILGQTINTVSSISILWYGSKLVMSGEMSIGEFMGFNAIIGCVMGPIMGLVGLYDQFQTVSTSMERLNDVLELEPEEAVSTPDRPKVFLNKCRGEVIFENVCFRYGSEDSPLVINNLNLEIPAGKVVAFVGKSGCGKSTLIKMLAGFNLPTSGTLRIDGADIKNVDIYSLRRNIGWVLQDSFLFSGSVADNIALGYTDPDMDDVIKAAKLAAADEFIIDFPMKYKTIVGEKGMAVSGGQRQRLCIARALYRNPQILLMDEATSSLDAQSERRIQENLNGILTGRTAVIIAHRLSTVRNADMICYLDAGHIVEKGTHDELMKAKGLYYQMATEQIGGTD